MYRLVEESLRIAKERFGSFGFSEEQTAQLLASGRRDLESELKILEGLLSATTPDIEAIDKSLHALKGLLLNLGNREAADMMNSLREGDDLTSNIERIRSMLDA